MRRAKDPGSSINRYPEDESLVKDASLFAVRHGLQPRLAGYYIKASAESPKDVRLHVALARLQTQRLPC